MFNIGPMEFVVLALVGIVVLGPDRLPQFARDAARMIRTLRDMATGARQQLREELGPEFADLDLRNLDPRTAVQRAVFGDEMPDLRKYSPGNFVRDIVSGEDEPAADDGAADDGPVSMRKSPPASRPSPNGTSVNGSSNGTGASRSAATGGSGGTGESRSATNGGSGGASRPRPRPRPRTHYDEDAT